MTSDRTGAPWPAASHALTVEFFGVTTRIAVPTREDTEHLHYYFHEHRARRTSPDVEIELQTGDGGSFVGALGAPRRKRVWWRAGGDWQLYEQFGAHSGRTSLVPPFGIEPLRSAVRTGHGAAVAAPSDDRALTILGASGSGKSVLLTTLMRLRWRFVTDDVLVLGRADGRLRYFGRPLGVRARSLALTPWARPELLDTVPRIPTALGDTYMVRPELVGGALGVHELARPMWTVRLARAPEFAAHTDARELRIGWDPDHDLDRLLDECLRHTGVAS